MRESILLTRTFRIAVLRVAVASAERGEEDGRRRMDLLAWEMENSSVHGSWETISGIRNPCGRGSEGR